MAERRKTLRKFAQAQEIKEYQNPHGEYLFGFEDDQAPVLPIKRYIRRLWLAFESSKRARPQSSAFLDNKAVDFSEEIVHWVNYFNKDPSALNAELGKLRAEDDPDGLGFLGKPAHTLLVEREWGDQLWGHRRNCTASLENSKPEVEDEKPPEWPRDAEQ